MGENLGFMHRKMRGFVSPKEMAEELDVDISHVRRLDIPCKVPRRTGQWRQWHDTPRLRHWVNDFKARKDLTQLRTKLKQPRRKVFDPDEEGPAAMPLLPTELVECRRLLWRFLRKVERLDAPTARDYLEELKPVTEILATLQRIAGQKV